MDSNKKTMLGIVFIATAFLVVTMLAQSCAGEKDKRNHLDHFTNVDGISLSSGGDQLTFTGCGHKDYTGCTIYRYDRKENVLYRYVHEDKSIQVMGAQYWSDSNRFLLVTVPKSQDGSQVLNQMQVAIMNPDGTGLKQLTEGRGVKAAYMLSHDGKTLVYSSGRTRTEGKTPAAHFDYHARDVSTGKEVQITDHSFYQLSTPYFTSDGKSIVFDNRGPMRIPGSTDSNSAAKYREEYERKYRWNTIIQYPVDGSGINRLPEPWFVHGIGSSKPIITKDGSLWFEGRTGGIGYYRRYPDGKITELTDEELVVGKTRCLFEMSIDSTVRWMAILYEDLGNDKARSLGIFDIMNRQCTSISVPATATNITIQ